MNFKKADFFPYIGQFLATRKLGIVADPNQDFFRYSVEWSLIVLMSRLVDVTPWVPLLCGYYFTALIFNLYQYLLRAIYQSEPNLFSDARLLKNGLAIVWHESRWKVILAIAGMILCMASGYFLLFIFFSFAISLPTTPSFFVVTILWLLTVAKAIHKYGFYKAYPNDVFIRYHFTIAEMVENIKRSVLVRKIVNSKVGKQYNDARKGIKFDPDGVPPNIHIFFIESYGSYYYREPVLNEIAEAKLSSFQSDLSKKQWVLKSNFSESPITGGQSWLTYSTALYGMKMSDNTVFESYLHDEQFAASNSLFNVLRRSGYTNYNLNPISPIKGINVPYDELRAFYDIDRWILKENMPYEGDVYGFGACPPDQYAMNFTMELIQKEKLSPYTFFYLTKNSHSPFIPPDLVEDWRELNHDTGAHHVHKGFLKHPTKEDYLKAIAYQFDNLYKFIDDYGRDNDIFLVMGDHQPPILSNPEKHGLHTPVHVISKNQSFLKCFEEYGFQEDISSCDEFIKHEAIYSIFLRSLIKSYGKESSVNPKYEPHGIQL